MRRKASGFWLFFAGLVPVLVMGALAARSATEAARGIAEKANSAAAEAVARAFTELLARNASVAEELQGRLLRSGAIRRRDAALVRRSLQDAAGYPGLDRLFVADAAGRIWADFPQIPGSVGQSILERPWIRRAAESRLTTVSVVHRQRVPPHLEVVSIVVPIVQDDGRLAGFLVAQTRLERFAAWLEAASVGERGEAMVVDESGTIVAHPSLDLQGQEYGEYGALEPVRRALAGVAGTAMYPDPRTGRRMLGAFRPIRVSSNNWAVVVQQPYAEVRAAAAPVRRDIALAAVLLALVAGGGLGAARRIEQRGRRLQEQVVRSEEELSRYAEVAAHDLQEPVRQTALLAQLLAARYGDDPTARSVVERMVESARRSQALVDDFLEHSRLRRKTLELEPLPAGEAVQAARARLQALFEGTGGALESGRLPWIRGDKAELADLFTRLFENSLKFRGDAPPVISVRARPLRGRWLFEVKDNGRGFEPQHAGRVFQLFERLEPGKASSGAGLAICRRIVERHGGVIRAESEPGKGAAFYFDLPAG